VRPLLATAAAGALPLVGVALIASHGSTVASTLAEWSTLQKVLLVIGTGVLICGGALLPTHALSLGAGWLLGGVLGPTAAWIGVTAGALVGFGVGRVLAGPGLVRWIDHHPRLAAVHAATFDAPAARATGLIALLRLSPIAPFAATNVALAALRPRPTAFVLGSAAGLAPRVAIVAWLGAGMAQLDFTQPHSPWLIGVGAAATLLLLIVMGWWARRALQRATMMPATVTVDA